MRKYVEVYFIYFLKPVLLILCFISNFLYLRTSQFVNDFYFFIYLLTFMLKPLVYLLFLFGLFFNYPTRSPTDGLVYIFTILGIFYGLPMKEIAEFYKLNAFSSFFDHLSVGYLLDEYLRTHYLFNVLIENFPIAVFVIVNNLILQSKYAYYEQYDPVIVNLSFILINGVMVCAFNH
jgi:hypothetical protein